MRCAVASTLHFPLATMLTPPSRLYTMRRHHRTAGRLNAGLTSQMNASIKVAVPSDPSKPPVLPKMPGKGKHASKVLDVSFDEIRELINGPKTGSGDAHDSITSPQHGAASNALQAGLASAAAAAVSGRAGDSSNGYHAGREGDYDINTVHTTPTINVVDNDPGVVAPYPKMADDDPWKHESPYVTLFVYDFVFVLGNKSMSI